MFFRLILLTPFIFFYFLSFSQKIDSLKTEEDVLKFVRKLKPEFSNLYINPPKSVYGLHDYKQRIKRFGGKSFAKADFDNNGETDLLFNGYMDDYSGNSTCRFFSFVVMSFGKDSFLIKELTLGSFINLFASKLVVLNNNPCIMIFRNKNNRENSHNLNSFPTQIDTLIYFLGDFIERAKPNKYKIRDIEFCTFGGWFPNNNFKISIINDSVTLEGDTTSKNGFESDSVGIFKAQIDSGTYEKIIKILCYIDFPHLKKQYSVPWTDDIESTITVNYNDNRIKKIKDYGLIGTYGLAIVENILFELKHSQKWKKIKTILMPPLPYCD